MILENEECHNHGFFFTKSWYNFFGGIFLNNSILLVKFTLEQQKFPNFFAKIYSLIIVIICSLIIYSLIKWRFIGFWI
jgi:hypothetical protein